MLYSQKELAPGKPGMLAESGYSTQRENYSPMSGGTRDQTKFSFAIDLAAARAAVDMGAKAVLEIIITPPASCCSEPIRVPINFMSLFSADSAYKMSGEVLCALNSSPRTVALGSFAYNAAKDEFTFLARLPGFPVDFEISGPGVTSKIETTPAESIFADRVTPGHAVVTTGLSNSVAHPNQDVNAATATECWAGVALLCEGDGEQAPAIASFPNFSNCGSPCAPPPTCVPVLRSGVIWIRLTEVPAGGCGKLYYRFRGENRGEFSAKPGPDFAIVPVPVQIKKLEGHLAKVRFN